MKKYIYAFLGLAYPAIALQETPWIGDTYEFYLYSDVEYSQYRWINRAKEQPRHEYRNYVTREGVSFSFSSNSEIELEVELARTPHQLYGFRSVALGGKYLLLDDIAGDACSLAVGGNIRNVGARSIADVSSPYAGYWNFEGTLFLGKEFSVEKSWKNRGYFLGTLGIAQGASVWNRLEAAIEQKIGRTSIGKVFCLAYLGYGSQKLVDIQHFHGWGKIAHRSIDIGLQYRYAFQVWGELGLSYAYRVLAVSYPKQEQTVNISYELPFSLF